LQWRGNGGRRDGLHRRLGLNTLGRTDRWRRIGDERCPG
jgi:hypothetical protein